MAFSTIEQDCYRASDAAQKDGGRCSVTENNEAVVY